ncbi:MAG: hypothetical protein ABIJ65_14890, partial [Chloroflexota bacterium]
LILAGVIDKDTKPWLESDKWTLMLSELRSLADIVIVNSPSVDSADAQILPSKMDSVILVIQLGRTQVKSAQATLRHFQLLGVSITGVVLI